MRKVSRAEDNYNDINFDNVSTASQDKDDKAAEADEEEGSGESDKTDNVVDINSRRIDCTDCDGSGTYEHPSGPRRCPGCGGTGKVKL